MLPKSSRLPECIKRTVPIEEIRGLLPGLSERLAETSRKNYQNLPGLAVPTFSVPANVNANDAMVLAQILATEIVSTGKYAVFPRTSSVDDVLKEAQFQRSGQTADTKALGTSRNIDYILASSVMSLGKMNLFASQVLNIEGGNAIAGADRVYQDITDGLNQNLMREIAGELTGVHVTLQQVSQQTANSSSSNTSRNINIISPDAGWQRNNDPKSTSVINIGKEFIDGKERDVLTIAVNRKTSDGYAGAVTTNFNVVSNLRTASGVRFKVLGDGSWTFGFSMNETEMVGNYHAVTVTTRNGRVVDIDVPFSKLRQPDWGKKMKFDKNGIVDMKMEKVRSNSTGGSTIKVFDFEIY